MKNPYESFADDPLYGVLGPIVWPRTYANLLYILLGFPLGLAYFVYYTVGLSLGLGLLIVGIGALVLLVVILSTWPLALLERELAIHLLGARVAPARAEPAGGELWGWIRDTLSAPVTWKGLVFLVVKFPLGLTSWIAAVVLLATVGGFVFAPAIFATGGTIDLGFWRPETLGETAILSAIGLVALVPALHLLNGLAWLWGRFAVLMLGHGSPAPRPAAAEPEVDGNGGASLVTA